MDRDPIDVEDEFDLDVRIGALTGLPLFPPWGAQTDDQACVPTGGRGAGGTCDTGDPTCHATCAGLDTCPDTCQGTCDQTCAATCRNTCPQTCAATCGQNQTCQATCGNRQTCRPTCVNTCGVACHEDTNDIKNTCVGMMTCVC